MSDYIKMEGFSLPEDFLKNVTIPNPMESQMRQFEQEQRKTLDAIEESRRAREAEQLRRHEELVDAIRQAGESGATIVIGDNAGDIQIQQNSTSSTQTMDKSSGLDYEKVIAILNEIKGYYDFSKFEETFQENTENVKKVIEETIEACQNNEDEGLIKKSLRVLRDLAIGTSGSLIASGILALIGQLPI